MGCMAMAFVLPTRSDAGSARGVAGARPGALERGRSTGVAHAGGDSVHREEQRARRLRVAGALSPHELHLDQVEGIDVGVAKLDRAGERRVALEELAAL